MNVAILGASPKEDRYAHKALVLLLRHGHEVMPINPAYPMIENLPCLPDLSALEPGDADTITVYMNPERTRELGPALIRAQPRRVIFNPGTENPDLAAELESAGITVEDACTLVLLHTGQF